MMWNTFKEKMSNLFDELMTAKFFVLISATTMLYLGKLGESNWVLAVLTVAGLHSAGDLVTAMKTPVAPAADAAKASNADV